jgi:tungstate transport system substrate-binding protein
MFKKKLAIIVLLIMLLATTGCSFLGTGDSEPERVVLATTTSTENSGLLAELIPPFEAENNYKIDVVAVGTGKALQHGRDGDADALLVHAREAELEFVENGYGRNREEIMYNDFVILGPSEDPAQLKDTSSAVDSFQAIADQEAKFISRGDNSGTHKQEVSIWEETDASVTGSWYQETGQGMGPSLTIANQKQGYILSDRGTYIAFKDKLELEILSENDPKYYNLYGALAVNSDLHPNVNEVGAQAFIDYLSSQKGQEIIKNYKLEGTRLFNPLQL